MLWQVAVRRKDRRVLLALNELSTTPTYKTNQHVQLTNLIGSALTQVQTGEDFAFLDWIYATFPDSPEHQHSHRQISSAQFDELALTMESIAIAEWIRDHDYTFPASMMNAAAGAGNLELVQFLHGHGTEGCTKEAMDSAASNGHLDVVKFLHGSRCEGCTHVAKTRALYNEHVDVLRFLHEEHPTDGCSSMVILSRAMNGRLECVKFAHEHNFRTLSGAPCRTRCSGATLASSSTSMSTDRAKDAA